MSSVRSFRAVAALIAATALVVSLVACSEESGPKDTDHPVVVASTDVWASVAAAVGGENADVSALFSVPGGDPHEFEPTNADTARVLDANVIVMNGGHYDEYMERAAADAKGVKVSALDGESDSGDHEGHSHSQEHAFYDLAVVADTADRIADALATVAPAHADAYRANAKSFRADIDALRARMAVIGRTHPNTRVAATEPLATALLESAGISDVAPAGFTAAVEEGQSPSAADRAAFDDLLTGRKVSALIYNVQAVDPATEAVLATANKAGVPVVQFTETLPDGVTDYIAWQSAQIAALEKALIK
ncbi:MULTISPECIES: metal ABC transporter solute-binding protein, Zn/Mn family [Gordonia]|jgi:zinc/manganese transport system substrate-binding protein|uniref:Putative ABC transporter substrate-binding protein n=1 Tax=Gordonia malaquae NBRC 108250 TaxID=1223542 RepID=M3UI95_GORML|nr:zinc ABC transporter substrate-binding protein [Gordonia malaquae]GAC79145.1 putative ABC transporter substrate-binding protein [Gordonia malaquae NBRC 108250]SEE07919.1 zinc/manganese transport system substrate-binding protein [Gordonia malaquae]